MIDLTGQTAIITGASGGIGAACATLLSNLGANLIITGTNLQKLEELKSRLPGKSEIKLCNLTNLTECEDLINSVEKFEILVCNAGITRDNLAIKMSLEDFQEVINVNLTANFVLNKAAIKKMLREKYGRIINISSVVAFTGNAGQANYTASKAGLVAMSKSLALEVSSRDINVNVVAPGFIETNMTDKLSEEQKEYILNKIPKKKQGTPNDIANIIAFLASPLSSYITGQTFHVNGGMFMA